MAETLRERTRKAVQREIGDAALELFAARGYEATTIDDIATAVGMSQRSVFRYFATKEEIVIAKLDLGTDTMLELLRARPLEEPVWTSLRQIFAVTGPAESQAAVKPIHRVIVQTPALRAVFLDRLGVMQGAVAEVLCERAEQCGRAFTPDDPTPRALTAAAFGCLVAAQHAWLAASGDTPLDGYIDRAMAAITPAG